ncbi:MAG: hypothetical protein ACD_17C00295G0002 [uncultured bacterium]|nr:MAG: hypothetical protein ACD_17C00295G0002 [uncultured bacterium]OGN55824.1 MAG: hypothetical protein A2796_04310 [Chlamydiae bacterium RIFCSPHIGHO2_01_FULL_44_39]OGN58327.1 MAG: hypothetical protein A3C42_01060 [Chlamydiae bacterium RIFCSPHIGHO2_02_FULL_45_9]OGN60356.1 MAG: hypothetical protein A3D96_04535 [Chlamydiae bacterium RIFCSPHIGHO2_12_FULL_44_59]OGN66339.1 MAG: hypothetical protein A2978_01980 [Chlamydiae bacterium RIFCSPLOWO2_01_FULL_44_52]OGN69290.1 MAG: hypothetical protein A3
MWIRFRNDREKHAIQKLGFEQYKRDKVESSALLLGKQYRKEIESGVLLDMDVHFVSQEIGYGAFSKEWIPQHFYIGEYGGLVRKNIREYFTPLNNYLMEYPVTDRLGGTFVIDAQEGNNARFINHSDQPNIKFFYAFVDGFYHAIFLTIREIVKGEELAYDYGANYWLLREPPEIIK